MVKEVERARKAKKEMEKQMKKQLDGFQDYILQQSKEHKKDKEQMEIMIQEKKGQLEKLNQDFQEFKCEHAAPETQEVGVQVSREMIHRAMQCQAETCDAEMWTEDALFKDQETMCEIISLQQTKNSANYDRLVRDFQVLQNDVARLNRVNYEQSLVLNGKQLELDELYNQFQDQIEQLRELKRKKLQE